jgi:uroporphyrin-3 C-methyltransferase
VTEAIPTIPPAAGATLPVLARPSIARQRAALRYMTLGVVIGLLVALAALGAAWQTHSRVRSLEQELVRRQQESQGQATEARLLARQAQDGMKDVAAKVAVLDSHVTEVAAQRLQLDDLIQSLSRSRDENMLVDIDAGIRVSLQQAVITGSAEPLVAVLRQSDERLARYSQPRLEGVRRAIARDLDRVKSVSVPDVPSLGIRLDEAVRLVDELPLAASPEARRPQPTVPAAKPQAVAASGNGWGPAWWRDWRANWTDVPLHVWGEIKSLVRVTRIDHPESMLLMPDQAFFLRENLKLRLLNARLALLSRQFDTAQADLQAAQSALDRYFDHGSRRYVLVQDLLKQTATQARQVGVPRPDETLAALAALSAGR